MTNPYICSLYAGPFEASDARSGQVLHGADSTRDEAFDQPSESAFIFPRTFLTPQIGQGRVISPALSLTPQIGSNQLFFPRPF